ncbi:hypothetical protein Q9290_02310 [Oceanimonas sp. CHS3-5]|uniref:hypothetical protein n=1 Tax=Oceanimonas sp. CHS3-5 TaxID=3068186 RepID=UPI00273F1898|nr:hypothetical protein [Oceanimonas sp. CHS3-5]MDP5291132.1 hypothetical protein [Oceanimonas sp. CHS3-5]
MSRGVGWLLLWLPLAGCAGQQERALARLEHIAGEVMSAPCAAPEYGYRQVKNPHVPGLIDEIETLRCPGLEAQTYLSRESARPDGMPIYLRMSGPHAGLPAFLQPGSPGAGLAEQLGPPAERSAARWRYGSAETTETVVIEWQGGVIRQLRWEWYFD